MIDCPKEEISMIELIIFGPFVFLAFLIALIIETLQKLKNKLFPKKRRYV